MAKDTYKIISDSREAIDIIDEQIEGIKEFITENDNIDESRLEVLHNRLDQFERLKEYTLRTQFCLKEEEEKLNGAN